MSSPISGSKEFTEYFSTVFPDLDSISHNVDPNITTAVLEDFLPCGNRQYLKVPADFKIIKSHTLSGYRQYIEETKQYIQQQQIQQQESNYQEKRFAFT